MARQFRRASIRVDKDRLEAPLEQMTRAPVHIESMRNRVVPAVGTLRAAMT
ncbi:MAG TPA: hypothetical protein PKC03_12285 [Dokdonella sp.]|jgi:hypothetical protein|nr:hypothetical protein [Dokdonella sp.]